MLEIFEQLSDRFSENQLVEFLEQDGFGDDNVTAFLQNHENDFTESDIELIRSVLKRDSEIHGW